MPPAKKLKTDKAAEKQAQELHELYKEAGGNMVVKPYLARNAEFSKMRGLLQYRASDACRKAGLWGLHMFISCMHFPCAQNVAVYVFFLRMSWRLWLLLWHLKFCRYLYLKVNRGFINCCYLLDKGRSLGGPAAWKQVSKLTRRALWTDGAGVDVVFSRFIHNPHLGATPPGLPIPQAEPGH